MELRRNWNEHQVQWVTSPTNIKQQHISQPEQQSRLSTGYTWSTISILRKLRWTRPNQVHRSRKNNSNRLRNYINFCLYSIISIGTPAFAQEQAPTNQTAIANPQATSTGSVTNQAVQVLQGPYMQHQFGGGVSCPSSTFNITPFATGGRSGATPYEPYADLDNDPSTPLERTGATKYNWRGDIGLSATISVPLDRDHVRNCKKAAETWTRRQAAEADKARLDFELVRLIKCGEAARQGFFFHPSSPYAKICGDVVVLPQKPPSVPQDSVSLPSEVTSEPSSDQHQRQR